MNQNIKKLLTQGLQGYATDGEISEVVRAGFVGEANHLTTPEGDVYHDEWYVPHHLGGGQELVKIGGEMFTRLYGGGTPAIEKLTELGLTVKEVGVYLKKMLAELGDKTRLDANCVAPPDGEWQYTYEILMKDPHIPVIISVESIFYKGTRVHLHPFILSPVK